MKLSRDGYLAVDHRRAFLPDVVSTSGRIHSELLRLLYILADIKTTQFFSDIGDKDYSHEAFLSLSLAAGRVLLAHPRETWPGLCASRYRALTGGRPVHSGFDSCPLPWLQPLSP